MTQVLYIDNHLLAVNKPHGISTQPFFEEQCREWLRSERAKNYLHVAHRIDRPVSGIVLCACSHKALTRLHAAMQSHHCEKLYIAAVTGRLRREQGSLEHYLFHDMDKKCALVTTPQTPFARHCLLSYKTLATSHSNSLLLIALQTGRYHQIRAQLAAIGHPIIGDDLYGSRQPFLRDAIALHHLSITLQHPTRDVLLSIKTQIPNSFSYIDPTWQIGPVFTDLENLTAKRLHKK